MSKELADALRDAILCVDPTANPETFKAAQLALTQYDTLPEAYHVTWEIDTSITARHPVRHTCAAGGRQATP